MILNALDWSIVFGFFMLSLAIGIIAARRAGRNMNEFFLSGRSMPWWLLGVSMVATTFSCDTPTLVTDIIRQNGVAGNWVWWAFLLTGMLTVFVYARLWRRSNVLTDLEFYEIRYSGRPATFLRGFRALYLGVVFNVLIIALVSLALTKISAVMLQWSSTQTLLVASVVTVAYSAFGGLRGVVLTDFFQFALAMVGAIGAAVFVVNLPEVGGLDGLVNHPALAGKLDLLPAVSNTDAFMALLVLPLAVQWWSVWYPGAEPGGGGYIAQRMLSARSERDSMAATLLFNVAHYALRPWPWILVALASIIVYPDLDSLRQAFSGVDPALVKNDFAYPAMLSRLPNGFLGLVVTSLLAAYMSTVSTHLNWGSSYMVNDVYRRFFNPEAGDRELVRAGRLSTIGLMLVSALFTLLLSNALQAFQIVLQIGAGTGLIFILRWFWWRINAYTEIAAMIISFAVALFFQFGYVHTGLPPIGEGLQLVVGVAVTTVGWLAVAFLTPATDPATLREFCRRIRPGGPGWRRVMDEARRDGEELDDGPGAWDVPLGLLAMGVGCVMVYSMLFAVGKFIYGEWVPATVMAVVAAVATGALVRIWPRLRFR